MLRTWWEASEASATILDAPLPPPRCRSIRLSFPKPSTLLSLPFTILLPTFPRPLPGGDAARRASVKEFVVEALV